MYLIMCHLLYSGSDSLISCAYFSELVTAVSFNDLLRAALLQVDVSVQSLEVHDSLSPCYDDEAALVR